MLTIRLQRVGKRNNPTFRVVLMDSRKAAKSGRFLEILGSYNPQRKGSLAIQKERISHLLSKGAQASATVHNLLVREGVLNAPKRNVVAPSTLKKQEAEQKMQSTPEVKTPTETVAAEVAQTVEKIEKTEEMENATSGESADTSAQSSEKTM
ncbi:MAG: small subunit ribosomal protein S16 [Parcubacteria group bacterium Gr01-1014_70]|nr:MAG: small subunit ribosomal protein S16 [Parcubacteria group bacterium Gr01-1014_70]